MQGLKRKTAIVNGAARGLGADCAARLSEEGANIVIADVLDEGESVAIQLRNARGEALFKALDVTDEAGWGAVIAAAQAEFGGVDILVNCAGISPMGHIEETSVKTVRAAFGINFMAAFLGMKAVLPAMRDRGGGSIVNIATNTTEVIKPYWSANSASKAALTNLTKTTAIHAARSGIRVNSIHPGPHETPMLAEGTQDAAVSAIVDNIKASVPLGRLGRPRDAAALVAFLASDDASYITATEIMIDGGLSAV